ncbi:MULTISPECIES: Uma2 family endonuclease [Nostocales]|uniref:Uma2 family endonuclease n=3 Tax=Nostocales TaxID=1161 RepID=A0A0C1QNQ9_9CYAN|nr:Uma2 family endonuclease [Tolypothrix bouteillei]KAF3889439.1 Uma2 family endonuclease [Tolypothrix bouteillei VB521301]
MSQAVTKPVTYEEFIEWFPNDGKRYELHKAVIVEMAPPTGDHEKVIVFLSRKLTLEIDRLNLPYGIPKTTFVKTPGAESTYSPDIVLLNLDNLPNEPLFQKESTVTQAASVPLVVEVVSTNWRDDYYDKFGDYEEMGIPEYWIADYKGLGGKKFIGDPKQPTFLVCQLVGDEYQITKFTGNDLIVSPTFPQLNFTAQQVFDSALPKRVN